MPLKRSKPTLAQCKATTSSGGRCMAKPHKDGLCFFHSDPKKAAELGETRPRQASQRGVPPMPLKRQPAANGKCRAATKAGRQCAAPAVRGGVFCALHNDPDRAAQLGRKGGSNNRKVYQGNERESTAPQNACDVKNLLAEVVAEIRAGRMDPKLGTT